MRRIFITFYILVLLSLLIVRFTIIPLGEGMAEKSLERDIENYSVEYMQGPLYASLKYLDLTPADEFTATIEDLQNNFGYPVKVVKIAELQLSESEIETLESGRIVTQDQWAMYYQRLPDSTLALAMGPVEDFDETLSLKYIEMVFWLAILCFVALLSLIWALPFWKNLTQMMGAATIFGSGKFDTRAEVGKYSPLKPMANTFNSMAERISGLIQSHKLLVNAVSHELRTPISRIRFGLEMLEDSDQKNHDRYLNSITEDVDELEELVAELLTYARFDQGTSFLHIQQVNTVDWLSEFVAGVDHLADGKEITIDISKSLETISIDPRYLGRAIENLLINALRFATEKVSVTARIADGLIRLSIADDGPGISQDDSIRIFDPFTRLDESRTRASGGYGLGLAIVKQVVNHHGGTVHVQESSSGGADFILLLPVAPAVKGIDDTYEL